MICEDVRLGLSAQLDGELAGPVPGELATHLAGCAGCRAWQADAAGLAGLVGLAAVEVPDLTERIMIAVAHDRDSRRAVPPAPADRYAVEAPARQRVLRLAVAAAAVVQLALAVPVLVSALVGVDVGAGPHASREMASFDVAVAVGFLLAAARPGRARAFLPVAVVLAGCLAVTSGIDIGRGATVASHEVGHLVELAQAGLLWALSRARPPVTEAGPGGGRGTGPVVA